MNKNVASRAVRLLLTAGVIAVLTYELSAIREDEHDYYSYKNTASAYTNISTGDNTPVQAPADKKNKDTGSIANSSRLFLNVDYALLREANEDAIGWIYIEGTNVNYPVMQAGNNSFYLGRDSFGEKSKAGAVFADCEVDCLNSDIVILYAHNMTGSSKEEMFSHLRNYEDKEYLSGNTGIITSFRGGSETVWKPFAAVHIDLNTNALELYRKTNFGSREQYDAYIGFLLGEAVATTGDKPEYGMRLLMMSTCIGDGSNNKRRVVFAYEKGET